MGRYAKLEERILSRVQRRLVTGTVLVFTLLVGAGLFAYLRPLSIADQVIRLQLRRAGVRSEYEEVDGNRIHYFEALPPDGKTGTPLVLIHGLGARGEDWSPMIPGLALAGFHVYVPDLLGYGRSPRPDASYSIGMQERMVADFMRAVHAERADVAGWSMGGWVAMKLALEHPEMVDRMVLFDAAGVYFQGYSDLETVFDAKDVAGVNRLFSLLTPKPRPIPEFVAKDLARRIQANVWVVKRSMVAMTNGRDLLNFRLQEIRPPTLVVWGKQDALIPLSAGESIYRGIPGSSMLVVDGCGHLTPSECSGASLRGTVEFLRAHPPITGGESVVDGRQKDGKQ